MVQIIRDFIPAGRRNRPGYKLEPRYITIHSTTNTSAGAGARAHSNYLKSATAASIPVSWHFSVDGGVGKAAPVIVQHLPVSENGWHAGDGSNGTGNRQSIGIEICENRDGDQAVAIRNAAWLTAKLMKEYGIPIDRVVQHNRWNGKNCPRILRTGNEWSNFLNQVRSFLDAGNAGADGPAISIRVNGKETGVTGTLRNNATEAVVSEVIKALDLGGTVTGHGTYINIDLPDLTTELGITRGIIADAKKLYAELGKILAELGKILNR